MNIDAAQKMELVPTHSEPFKRVSGEEQVTVPRRVLVEALRLAYEAGLSDAASADRSLEFIERHTRNMQRSLRKAVPLSVHGVDAGLELIRLAARNARGLDIGIDSD